jgi:hypothetical protein
MALCRVESLPDAGASRLTLAASNILQHIASAFVCAYPRLKKQPLFAGETKRIAIAPMLTRIVPEIG